MPTDIALNHPKQKLLFYVAQDFGTDLPHRMERAISEVACSREWLVGPPDFVDEFVTSALGSPVRTVGGLLQIYTALPPSRLPLGADRQHLDEVGALVEALREFSLREGLAIEFELDGVFVGAVEDGNLDPTLAEGLLGEWRRSLDGRGSALKQTGTQE